MQETIVSTGGRICIAGEGTSRLQGRGLTAAIAGLETQVRLQSAPGYAIEYGAPFDKEKPTLDYVAAVCRAFKKREPVVRDMRFMVTSTLPHGEGLSSSAALCVATASAINQHFKLGYSARDIAEIAFEGETKELGIACGKLDHYAIAFKGVLFQDYATSPLFVEKLSLPDNTVIVIGSIGSGSPYSPIGASILERYNQKDPSILAYREHVITSVDTLRALLQPTSVNTPHTQEKIGHIVSSLQRAICESLKVHNKEIDALVSVAIENGAYAAKTSGIRYEGGCMFALCTPETAPRVAESLTKQGATSHSVTLAE